jgi:hypothetical protein
MVLSSLPTIREKLIEIGAKFVRADATSRSGWLKWRSRELFADIQRRMDRLRPKPTPA